MGPPGSSAHIYEVSFAPLTIAMAEEMHNFYQEEDLYTYMEGSTPSLDQASYSGIPGEDEGEKLVLVTKDELEHKLAGLQVITVILSHTQK